MKVWGNRNCLGIHASRHDVAQKDMQQEASGRLHALPSRMTVSQPIEGLVSELCAIEGSIVDGTFFRPIDIEEVGQRLKAHGFNAYGLKTLYNGCTGEQIEAMIFMTPTYYQRLQKFVEDSVYAVDTGPTCAITRQPLGGKSSSGGLKLGEMEKDVIVSTGATLFLEEKFYDHSDRFVIYICATCGSRDAVVVNDKAGIYKCNNCKDAADINRVPSSYSSKLFMQELRTMNVGMRWQLKAPVYEYNL